MAEKISFSIPICLDSVHLGTTFRFVRYSVANIVSGCNEIGYQIGSVTLAQYDG